MIYMGVHTVENCIIHMYRLFNMFLHVSWTHKSVLPPKGTKVSFVGKNHKVDPNC